jgi:hypothetical protein
MDRPLGVAVIAVLYWVGAVGLVAIGAFLAIGLGVLGDLSSGVPPIITGLGAAGGGLLVIMGAGLFAVGWGLLKRREWARMLTCVLAVVAIVFTVLSFTVPMWGGIAARLVKLAFHGLVLWYLNQAHVKAVFRR